MTKTYLIDKDGNAIYVATLKEQHKTAITFHVEQIVCWMDDENHTPVEDDNEQVGSFTIRWDGCCDVTFGEPTGEEVGPERDGYLHICGPEMWQQHIKMLEWIYKLAQELFGAQMEEWARWKD